MKLYNHLADIGFSVVGPWENFEDIPSAVLLNALRRRVEELETHPDDVADAFGDCGACYEVTEEAQQLCVRLGQPVINDDPEAGKKEDKLIRLIAARGAVEVYGYLSVLDELVARLRQVQQACPLRLQELLEADDADFTHDIAGIMDYWKDGEFQPVFQPRYAVQS